MDMQVDVGRRTNDEMFKAGAGLALRGYKLVRLYGISADGACECHERERCENPGKHPVGNAWQHRATTDESVIESWFADEREITPNFGVLLGRESGVIDVEYDSEEAAEGIATWGLDQVDTPAFRSGRGIHRLFAREPGLPDAAVVKKDGIEVRLGGGGKAAQTVLPPSWHASGFAREWLPGRSPEECELQPLPRAFRDAVIAAAGAKTGGGCVRDARAALVEEEFVGPGDRHRFLLGMASDQVFKERNLDEDARRRVLTIVRALNQAKCRPPKDDSEVVNIVDSQLAHYRRGRTAGRPDIRGDAPDAQDQLDAAERERAARMHPWERAGLQRNDNRWEPGEWRVVRVHSDPPRFRLIIPPIDGQKPCEVNLTTDDWTTPKKVAQKILVATGTINMQDPTPGDWGGAWSGCRKKNDAGGWDVQRGLAVQLLEPAHVTHEYPPPELSRAATVASLLHSHLIQARETKDEKDTKPNDSGSAKWLYHEGRKELWFHWITVWTEINETAETPVTAAEKQDLTERLLRRLGKAEFDVKQGSSGRRLRYMRWGQPHLEALARIAGLEDCT